MVANRRAKELTCIVCGDKADGVHFNTLSCRGCVSFFRRAITRKTSYVCRKNGNCPVTKDDRCTCRACRLQKCRNVGMDETAVQPKRGTYKSYRWVSRRKKPNILLRLNERVVENHTTLPSSSSASSTSSKTSPLADSTTFIGCQLIGQLTSAFKEEDRRYRILLAESFEELISCGDQVEILKPMTLETFIFAQRIFVTKLLDWCDLLPEFRKMDPPAKTKFIKAFAMKFFMFEGIFGTVRSQSLNTMIFFHNYYVEPGKSGFESLHDDEDTIRLKARLFVESISRMSKEIINPMIELKITESEMAILRYIVFWNPGEIGLDDTSKELAKQCTNRAFDELHTWYKKNKVANGPERIGNIILLLPAFLTCVMEAMELNTILSTFNMVGFDPVLEDLMRP